MKHFQKHLWQNFCKFCIHLKVRNVEQAGLRLQSLDECNALFITSTIQNSKVYKSEYNLSDIVHD